MIKKYLLLIFSLLIFSLININQHYIPVSATITQNEIVDNNNPIVMFQQGKNQYFNSTIMASALKALEDNNITVITSSEPINKTSLTGIDVLIIPGSPSPLSSSQVTKYSDSEISYIKEWLEQPNHGLILLSNPLTSNSRLNINSNDLNLIISRSEQFSDTRFTEGSNGFGVTLHELNPGEYNNASVLNLDVVNSSEFSFEGEKKTVTMSNNVKTVYPMIEAGMSVFGISSTGSITLQGKNPVILGGSIDETTSSRLFLIGSALMFSDLPGPDSSNTTTISWFNTADNAQLWLKLVDWTINKQEIAETPDTFLTMISFVSTQFILGIVFIFIGFLFSTRYSTSIKEKSTITASISSESPEKPTQSSKDESAKKIKSSKKYSSRRKQKRKK